MKGAAGLLWTSAKRHGGQKLLNRLGIYDCLRTKARFEQEPTPETVNARARHGQLRGSRHPWVLPAEWKPFGRFYPPGRTDSSCTPSHHASRGGLRCWMRDRHPVDTNPQASPDAAPVPAHLPTSTPAHTAPQPTTWTLAHITTWTLAHMRTQALARRAPTFPSTGCSLHLCVLYWTIGCMSDEFPMFATHGGPCAKPAPRESKPEGLFCIMAFNL